MSERLPVYGLSEFSKPKSDDAFVDLGQPEQTSIRSRRPEDAQFSGVALRRRRARRLSRRAGHLATSISRRATRYHHRFWGQLLRWAVARDLAEGSQTVRLSTDKSRYEQGEPSKFRCGSASSMVRRSAGAACQCHGVASRATWCRNDPVKEDANRPGTYHGTPGRAAGGPDQPAGVEAIASRSCWQPRITAGPIETTINIDPSGL